MSAALGLCQAQDLPQTSDCSLSTFAAVTRARRTLSSNSAAGSTSLARAPPGQLVFDPHYQTQVVAYPRTMNLVTESYRTTHIPNMRPPHHEPSGVFANQLHYLPPPCLRNQLHYLPQVLIPLHHYMA
jgi:hypothetical protein